MEISFLKQWLARSLVGPGLAVALAALLALGLSSAPAARAETRLKPAWVTGSVARLRQAPDEGAAIIARLRIGAEVRVFRHQGRWAEVTTAIGERGFVKRSLLAKTPPRLDSILRRADQARSPANARLWLERATAFAPGDVGVIRRLIESYRALGRDDAAWSVEKGIIAAERRQLSWDGPLYPVVGDTAWLPRPCPPGVTAKTRAEALAGQPKPPVPVLRGRAFPLVNSGKVVAISERGNKTRVLDAPVCRPGPCGEAQAGFALDDAGGDGLLVPSWLVAGFRVDGYQALRDAGSGHDEQNPPGGAVRYGDSGGRTRIDVVGDAYTLSLRTFDGWRALGTWPLLRKEARPVAQASEHERGLLLFWRGDSARACCPGEVEVWAERIGDIDEKKPTHDAGRVYSQGLSPGCAQALFSDLEGEPRCERLPGGCHLDDRP